ncbi:MAG: hypothetical protein REI93_10335, partial [Pedobacter sp.]|nr:hypothetical protein [Pedobacter sp.]
IYINAKWKPILGEKIRQGVEESSGHLYYIDFKDIHINLLSGNVVLDSLKLTPDTNIFNKLKKINKAPTHLYRIKLAHLKFSRVGILNAYLNKKIKINSIVLDHPSIDMIFHKVPKKPDTVKVEKTLYQQLSKSISSLHIGNIRVIDADFDYYSGTKKLNVVKHLKIDVKDFLVDSISQYDSTRVLHAKNIGFELAGYQSLTADQMYTIKVDSLKGSISRKTMILKGLKLIPMYPDLTFSRKYKVQKDRYSLSFTEMELTGLDFLSLHSNGSLHAGHLAIGAAKVAVFLNRELPPPSFDKGRNYPHNALKRLPIATRIDTVSLKGVDVAYTEYDTKTNERGTLKLENLGGKIFNVSNDSLRLLKHPHAYADLSTKILGTGKLNVKIDFNLTDKNAAFSYTGHVEPFDMRILNPLASSLGLVSIESGKVKQLDFNISANERRSAGTVKFLYNDLKVSLLKENEAGEKKKKGLLSFLANAILIKNDNPSKGDPVRIAHVTMERVPQASFFNLMWKSVFLGIREAVGIGVVPIKPMVEPKKSREEMREKREAERRKEKPKQPKKIG